MDYGHPDLFTTLSDEKTIAVIDANVFFDLALHEETHRSAESRALRADWLQNAFVLAVTPELQTEISRNHDDAEQRKFRAFAGTFVEVKAAPEQVETALSSVKELLGPGRSSSDYSDRRQLAYAIAAESDLFLTCDNELLERAESLEERFGVRVMEPVALINDIDATDQPSAYAPARLEGSGLMSRQMRTEDLEALKQAFLYFGMAESVAGLPRVLRELLTQPRRSRVHVVTDASGAFTAVFGVERATDRYRIRALRVRGGRVASTLARHLLWRAINDAAMEGATSIIFDDPLSDERVQDSLSATGFIRNGNSWTKLIVRGAVEEERLVSHVDPLINDDTVTSSMRNDLAEAMNADKSRPANVIRIEHVLWPLKLKTDVIPCYIVPIQPAYAAALFDTIMASESLFDANVDLLLRLENVYYRSSRPMLEAPARILWYVSGKGTGYSHAGHMSAASILTSVVVGKPKDLHAKFRRYGIYAYADVKRIGDEAMAFTFTQTEMLTRPLPLVRVREVLSRYVSPQNPLASPVRIPANAWFDLYAAGAPGRV